MAAQPPRRIRGILLYLAKVAVGVGIVAYLLAKYDWRTVADGLLHADLGCVVIAWAFGLLGLVFYAVMNRIALRPLKMPLTTLGLLKILFQTRFYALFLPGGANVLVKWYKLSKPGRQPAQALALMAFSRTLHLFSLLFWAVVGIWGDALFPWPGLRWCIVGLLGLTALALCCFMSDTLIEAIRARVSGPWQRLPVPAWLRGRAGKVARLATAFKQFGYREAMAVLLLAIAGNFVETIQHVYIARAVGVDLSFFTLAWLRGVLVVCAIVPISLAGLGIREAGVVALLVLYGVTEPKALAYSLLFYGAFVVGKGLVGGALELWDWFRPKVESPL